MEALGHEVKQIAALLDDPACDLLALIIAEGQDLKAQIAEKTERIDERTSKLKPLVTETDLGRRLQIMSGIGPLTALAVEAFAPDMAQFKCGRDFAAWLGIVPRQHSSGGKAQLGQIESRAERHLTASDHRGDVTVEPARSPINFGGFVAREDAGAQPEDDVRDCVGEQDGSATVGDVDEE